MSAPDVIRYWDVGLKITTTVALILVALLGTRFVTKDEFTATNQRIEKIEAVLIRMEQNALIDARHETTLNDHEIRIRQLEKK
jgi:hypothetical protein